MPASFRSLVVCLLGASLGCNSVVISLLPERTAPADAGSRDASLPLDGQLDADAQSMVAYCEASTQAGMALTLTGAGSYGSVARQVQDDFTLEVWIRTTHTGVGEAFWQGNGLIYADVQGGENDFGTSILNGKFAFAVGLGPFNSDAQLLSMSDVAVGQWMHVAATRRKNTGELQILVNGILENATITTQTNSLAAAPNFTIGANTVDGTYFIGEMDELRIWNIVRSPAEVLSTMHEHLRGDESGLVGYFRFDDSGTVAVDASPTKVDATLQNPISTPSDAPICN